MTRVSQSFQRFILVAALLSIVAIHLSACTTVSRIDHVPLSTTDQRDLIVFFDGTANDEGSHTNVAKLHNLVSLQNNPAISTTYIRGVGTNYRILGMATGWGIGHDVRDAYLYLIENYHNEADRISIFGFSRGAYASRILASLLYVAGIPNVRHWHKSKKKRFVNAIYSAYKDKKKTIAERRKSVQQVMAEYEVAGTPLHAVPVYVTFLGLWDTVEALGLPNYQEDIDEPNTRYADQLCNIKAAAHAVAIDDNRARVFTPLLLTRQHLRDETCDAGSVENQNSIKEVWFSGAHSDVGGGYLDTHIDGVSLNWMLDQIDKNNLKILPHKITVYSDYLGLTHNPEAGLAGLIYRKRNRNIICYTADENDSNCKERSFFPGITKAGKVIHLHQSVLDRQCLLPVQIFESDWYLHNKYSGCFKCDEDGRGELVVSRECRENISINNNDRYEVNYRLRSRSNDSNPLKNWLTEKE